jgi:hypothetical protein
MNRALDYFILLGFIGDFNAAGYLFSIVQQCQELTVCSRGILVIQKQPIKTASFGG